MQGARPKLTHFLCIPLITTSSRPQLEQTLRSLHDKTCASNDDGSKISDGSSVARQRLDPRAIRPVGTLHLTLGVMSLTTETLAQATALLDSIDLRSLLIEPTTLETRLDDEKLARPLQVDLVGLEPMHEAHSTSVLYAAPHDSSDRLYDFALALQKQFRDHGYLVEEHRELKLHATIVNTTYARSPKTTAGRRRGDKMTGMSRRFDARDLIDEFRGYVWASNVLLDRVAICEMGAERRFDTSGNVFDEAYREVATVRLL